MNLVFDMLHSLQRGIRNLFTRLSVGRHIIYILPVFGFVIIGLFWMILIERRDLIAIVRTLDLPPGVPGEIYSDITIIILMSSATILILVLLILIILSLRRAYVIKSRVLDRYKSYTDHIVDSINRGIIGIDRNGVITQVNRAALGILGQPARALVGAHFMESLRPREPLSSFLLATLRQEQEYRDEVFEYTNAEGKQMPLCIDTFVLRDSEHTPIGAVLIAVDRTRSRRIEERIKKADRLAVVARLGQKMAHEIRNPMSAMDINTQLLIESLEMDGLNKENSSVYQYASIVYAELRRLDELLDNFFNFSRSTHLHRATLDIHDLLREILRFIEPEAREHGISLSHDFTDETVQINGDRNQLKQAFLNVIINGIQSMPKGGRLRVETFPDADSDFITIEFADSGSGIPMENMDKIFDIYFTTKKGGSGLGLSIAHQIIHQHNGTIDAMSWVGDGSIFSIRLPVISEETAGDEASGHADNDDTGEGAEHHG